MRAALACAVIIAAPARADPPASVTAHGEAGGAPAATPEDDWLVRPVIEDLGDWDATGETHARIRGADLTLHGARWIGNELSTDPAANGWRASVALSRDVGFARLGVYATADRVDSRFERGTMFSAGIALTRTLRLSRWMTAWLSLSVGVYRWTGTSPADERSGAAAMVTLGTTFR